MTPRSPAGRSKHNDRPLYDRHNISQIVYAQRSVAAAAAAGVSIISSLFPRQAGRAGTDGPSRRAHTPYSVLRRRRRQSGGVFIVGRSESQLTRPRRPRKSFIVATPVRKNIILRSLARAAVRQCNVIRRRVCADAFN